jgi:hypothetical protein
MGSGLIVYHERDRDGLPLVRFRVMSEGLEPRAPSGWGERPEFEGHVRFDGCINWQTDDGCMAHFCGPDDADAWRAVFARLWELPAEYGL